MSTSIEIKDVREAWHYCHQQLNNPGYRRIGSFASQSKHGGIPGITHIISLSTEKNELEYLTRKSYWSNARACKINRPQLLPAIDRPKTSLGETIKTRMLNMWMENLFDLSVKKLVHVTVMKDGTVYTFNAQKIISYVTKFDAYCDHDYVGAEGAAYYPQRLADQFPDQNSIDGKIAAAAQLDPGQATLF